MRVLRTLATEYSVTYEAIRNVVLNVTWFDEGYEQRAINNQETNV
jgi:hypothetical protein